MSVTQEQFFWQFAMNPFFNVAGGLTETRRAPRLHRKEKELIGIQAKSFMENLEILESSAAARIKNDSPRILDMNYC